MTDLTYEESLQEEYQFYLTHKLEKDWNLNDDLEVYLRAKYPTLRSFLFPVGEHSK